MTVQDNALSVAEIIIQFFFKNVLHALRRFFTHTLYKHTMVRIEKN